MKQRYKDYDPEVSDYMNELIDQLVNDFGDVNPSWVTALDVIGDWYGIYLDARKSLNEKGVIVTKSNGDVQKNPAFSVFTMATQQLNNAMKTFGANPMSKAKMKHYEKGTLGVDDLAFIDNLTK
jgi:P27 family predicted phage terminase small subunit